jgi:hypothetical protein
LSVEKQPRREPRWPPSILSGPAGPYTTPWDTIQT